MYLLVEKCFKLDKIVKSFEVAYRGYITTLLLNKYDNINKFSIAVNQLDTSIKQSPILGTKKFKQRITKIKAEIGSYYQKIQDSYANVKSKDYDNNVPFVSELIDFVVLFFDGCFNNLAKGFSSLEDFNSSNVKYYYVRNWLSHPASSKITADDAKHTLIFIKKTSQNISLDYFWFVSKKQIYEWCEELLGKIEETNVKYHNLSTISFTHQKLIERELELNDLKNLLFGKDKGYRRSGSVAVYGYGGIGKTAFVLEFLYRTIKEIYDKIIKDKIDFLLFFTAKEELLSFNETTKKLYIRDINKQIIEFDDFKDKLLESLELKTIDDLKNYSGILAIDNFETIKDHDKPKFFEFIKMVPRSIQFIITSRNEEPCEDKINLKEFCDKEKGLRFINTYIDYYELKIKMKESEMLKLIELSKGNTLIIVLSLQMLSNNHEVNSLLSELEGVESANIEIISDFMYKNTISHAIEYLESNNHNPIEILKVISLYDVPVDLYSLSKIAGQTVQSVEFVCDYLSTKIILEKIGETYKPNEFANKFIVSKYIPNRIELKRLKEKIREHQRELNYKLKKLEDARKKQPLLDGIMEDWKPKNSIDTVAISEAFSLFGKTKEYIENEQSYDLEFITTEFIRLEKMTSHPYIRFQKARCFQQILEKATEQDKKIELEQKVSDYYEEAIDTTDFYYPYIKNTKSYASINWIYGSFISYVVGDLHKSLRYLEDAILIFKRIKIFDKAYYTAINNLSWVYSRLYSAENDNIYLSELKPLFYEIKGNREKLLAMGFNYDLYLQNFGKHFRYKKMVPKSSNKTLGGHSGY